MGGSKDGGMSISAGSRWRSAVDTTEVIVVKAPASEVVLECSGLPMIPLISLGDKSGTDNPPQTNLPPAAEAAGTLLGKRYMDESTGLEVLCTKGGLGSLSVSGRPLIQKQAKPLPSSD